MLPHANLVDRYELTSHICGIGTMSAAPSGTKLAPFTPSGDGVLAFALELLQLTKEDVLFDLGCGDGRMLVHAAKETGARSVGPV